MKDNIRIFSSIFKIRAIEGFQYRIAALAGATTGLFWVLIEITIYTVFYTYSQNKDAGFLAGLSLRQVITYAWLAQLFFVMQPMNIESDIISKINSGDVGIELCKPIDLYFHWFSKAAASKISPLIWRGTVILLISIVIPFGIGISPPASLAGFISMLLTFVSAFFLCASYGMLVCTIRMNINLGDGPMYMLMFIGGILSGSYLPLQLWPQFMQKFLILQPFAGYLDLPVRFYIGTIEAKDIFWVLGIQIFWTVIFIIAGKFIMAKRLRSIVIQGG